MHLLLSGVVLGILLSFAFIYSMEWYVLWKFERGFVPERDCVRFRNCPYRYSSLCTLDCHLKEEIN
jgi:hypothetical protein